MSRRVSRRITVVSLAPVVAIALLSLYRPATLSHLEHASIDTVVRAAPLRVPDSRVVIVDVDERSIAEIGQWPWRRDRIAALVTRLRDLGAAVVALDIVFAEPDRPDGSGVRSDEVLADALRAGRTVLGYGLTFEETVAAADACVQHPLGVPILRSDDEPGDPFFRATGTVCNLSGLTSAASSSGFLNAAPDADGVLRRVPLVAAVGDRIYPAFSLAALAAAGVTRAHALRVLNVNASWLELDGTRVPLDGQGNLLLRFRGPKRTFRYVSVLDIFRSQAPLPALNGAIALIGTTALGTREVVSTPFDTLFTGVEVQATVVDNVLQRDFLHRPASGALIEAVLVLVAGVLVMLAAARSGVLGGVAVAVVCLAGLWGTAVWLVDSRGLVLSPLLPTVAVAATVAVTTAAGFLAERQRAENARRQKAGSERLMIQSLLSLTEIKDAETGRHSRRTQHYTRALAERLAARATFSDYFTPERIELLATLAPLHDIGKVGVPDRLLRKPGALSPSELQEIRRHPAYGRDVISKAERDAGVRDDVTLALAKDIVYSHHEKWDGSGYPEGLRGSDIPIAGRIIAVVDVYDALRSTRPYSEPMSHEQASAAIVAGSGTHFDPVVVEAFVAASDTLRRLSENNYR